MLINGLGIGVPYKTFRGAGETLNQSSLYLPLKSTIVPSKGTSTPTFTRATAAWSFDNEGKLNLNVPSGCARFQGGRLVRNLIPVKSEDLSNAAWTKQGTASITGTNQLNLPAANDGVFSGVILSGAYRKTYRGSVELSGSGSIVFALRTKGGSAYWITSDSALINLTASPTRYTVIGTNVDPSTTGVDFYIRRLSGATATTVIADKAQLEDVSGQADQTAGEYVSVGVLSAPYHGAGVDGCKWFPTNKDGSAISSSTLEGYFAEPQRTNNCLWNRDLTNVAWTNTNITAAKTAIGLDNVANSATRLTAAATDATITQLLTAATGTRTFSAYIKRISGSGTISLTRNGGTNWTDITSSLVTGSWVLVKMTSDVGANPTVGIKMGTSGDVIDVDCVQDENGAWATSPILTTTAAVTRNADVLSYASAFDVAQGTALCSVMSSIPINSGSQTIILDSTNCTIMYLNSASARTTTLSYDGLNTATVTGNDITTAICKRAVRWGADLRMAADGMLGTATAFDGGMGASGTIEIAGEYGIQLSGTIRDVHIWPTPLTDTQMKQVTT